MSITTTTNTPAKSAVEAERDEILATLAELGGGQPSEDDLIREGRKLIVPTTWTLDDAIQYLRDYKERDNQLVVYDRVFKYRPLDGARALQSAIKKAFGMSPRMVSSFFSQPQEKTVTVGPGQTETVPWGEMDMPLVKGEMHLSAEHDEELGQLFKLFIRAPRRFRNHIEGLFLLVEEELRENSIYRGKAIFGSAEPEFLPLDRVKPEHVVYSEDVLRQLDTNVWANCKFTEQMRANNLPLKRAVLLHGQYGTGKTLAAYRTAQEAVRNGWTFLYCRPAKDDIYEVMATARIYAPAVVFVEDVDEIASGEGDSVSRLLDAFDGITAKGAELMVMLTTNHPDRIHKGMLRAGRLDAVIEIGNLDRTGVEKLVKVLVPEHQLDPRTDFDVVFDAMKEFAPAFVKEAIDRAKRNSIRRNDGELGTLDTEDFQFGAHDLAAHLALMNDAGEGSPPEAIGAAIERTVRGALDATVVFDPRTGYAQPVAEKGSKRLETIVSNGGEE